MHSKKRFFLAALMSMLLASPAALAEEAKEKQAADHRSEVTIDEIGQLDNQIEMLKKKLEIRKLEAEIKEAEDEKKEPQESNSSFGFKRGLDQFSFGNQSSAPPPQNREEPPDPSGPPEEENQRQAAMEQQQRQAEMDRQNAESADDFNEYVSRMRVVSISGFGKNVSARFKLPEGGALTVKKGGEYGFLGKVKDVSSDNVVLSKNDRVFQVPFSERFKEFQASVRQSTNTGMADDSYDMGEDSADDPPVPPNPYK